MKEDIENKNNRELLSDVSETMGRYMNHHIEDHPYYSLVFKEIELRMSFWKRMNNRKLKVKYPLSP